MIPKKIRRTTFSIKIQGVTVNIGALQRAGLLVPFQGVVTQPAATKRSSRRDHFPPGPGSVTRCAYASFEKCILANNNNIIVVIILLLLFLAANFVPNEIHAYCVNKEKLILNNPSVGHRDSKEENRHHGYWTEGRCRGKEETG